MISQDHLFTTKIIFSFPGNSLHDADSIKMQHMTVAEVNMIIICYKNYFEIQLGGDRWGKWRLKSSYLMSDSLIHENVDGIRERTGLIYLLVLVKI